MSTEVTKGSRLLVVTVATLCKLVMKVLTRVNVHNGSDFYSEIRQHAPRRPLITVSNHTSTLDDPLLLSEILSLKDLYYFRIRWALGARDVLLPRCCTVSDQCHPHVSSNQLYSQRLISNSVLNQQRPDHIFNRIKRIRSSLGRLVTKIMYIFFDRGQVIFLNRGKPNHPPCADDSSLGINQPAMNYAISLLNRNNWIHVFPEGRIDPQSNRLSHDRRLKWGVARLILESSQAPILIPFVHQGMERVKPLGKLLQFNVPKVDVFFGPRIDTEKWRVHAKLKYNTADKQREWIMVQIASSLRELYPNSPLNA